MKPIEKTAFQFLSPLFDKVIYEPIPNQTPDFLCDDKIAVEVRLLNQHTDLGGRKIGLEIHENQLRTTIEKVISEPKFQTPKQGWFVHFRFIRPIPEKSETIRFVKKKMQDLLNGCLEYPEFDFADGNLEISFVPRLQKAENIFELGGWTDCNTVGFLESELIRNIEICITEKANKIEKNYALYPEWWLIFFDRIGGALLKPYLSESPVFKKYRNLFSRIILINYDNSNLIDI